MVSKDWNTLRIDFAFHHELAADFRLVGEHAEALCLRCRNDRGPVEICSSRGYTGCLGDQCLTCHSKVDWQPQGQLVIDAMLASLLEY